MKEIKKKILKCIDCGKEGTMRSDAGLKLAFPYCDNCFKKMVRICRKKPW